MLIYLKNLIVMMLLDVAFTGATIIGIIAAFLIVTAGVVAFMRYNYRSKTREDLAAQYENAKHVSPIYGKNKYPGVDAFANSKTNWLVGLVAALGISVLAFSWTTYDPVVDVSDYLADLEEDIEVAPPPTSAPPPPPPPPPPPEVQAVPDEEILEEEQQEFEDQSADEKETEVVEAPIAKEKPKPKPKPKPKKKKVEEIFQVVEQMPRFPGCEDLAGSNDEKKQCADKKMLEFIYKNIKYPAIARENDISGMVVIQFVVEKDGTVTDAKVVRDIGGKCGDEALRIVNKMNSDGIKWTPGQQRGRNVRVQFNLPVRFKLN